ncbi:major facilitator superfamily MFS_1 [Ammonifex degensii KC4]|uniref:Major facilitator superfamily MFS_1 n=1 Tax=Ammonifex degensii (strain DSM 10501 / KC4) TaxID=429009 RepID=C9R8C8_AMMDK|nr:MFS transporter [Ammonifex degensii]ACX52557.1 major facilitator superfamily MFS_1 [Ammonifex degensii KC4]
MSRAWLFIFFMGLVSLFGDITYEGARSIIGPFMASLGASAAIVGFFAGLGELGGYALRLIGGYLADRTERYWLLTGLGYLVNLLAVPSLALAGRWETAAALMVIERAGKGLRTPPRDAMLSYATSQVGRGWGFGFHEAMDQIGAITGPLLAAGVLSLGWTFRQSFALYAVPAFLALIILAWARISFPVPKELEISLRSSPETDSPRFPQAYWYYLAFSAVAVAGFLHFQILAYHFKVKEVLSDAAIPFLYAGAMATDAAAALLAGRFYDRIGLRSLIIVPFLTVLLTFLVLATHPLPVVAGTLIWGVVMGLHESTLRAAIADLTPIARRGLGYGIFNTVYGTAAFLSGALLGMLYDRSPHEVIILVVVLEAIAFLIFLQMVKHWRAFEQERNGKC